MYEKEIQILITLIISWKTSIQLISNQYFALFYLGRAVINMTPFIPTSPHVNPLERLQANPGIYQYQLYFHKEVCIRFFGFFMKYSQLMTGWTGRRASNRGGERRAGNGAYEFIDSRSTEVFAFFSLVFSNLAAKTHLRQFSMNFQWCRVTVTVPIR